MSFFKTHFFFLKKNWLANIEQKKTTHTKLWISDYFQIARNIIVAIVFHLIINQTEFRLVHNQKKYCQYDHIPFNLKGNYNIVFWTLLNQPKSEFIYYFPIDLAPNGISFGAKSIINNVITIQIWFDLI